MDGYVRFMKIGTTPSGKTEIYEVQNDMDEFLGEVKWHTNWRRYVFFPDAECKFDATCLQELSDFCSGLMKQHKNKKGR